MGRKIAWKNKMYFVVSKIFAVRIKHTGAWLFEHDTHSTSARARFADTPLFVHPSYHKHI